MKLTFTTYMSLCGLYLTFIHGCGKAVMEDNYKYASSEANATKITGEEAYTFEKSAIEERGNKQLDSESLPPKHETPPPPVEDEVDEEITAIPPTIISGAYLTCSSYTPSSPGQSSTDGIEALGCNVSNDEGVIDISEVSHSWELSYHDGKPVDFWFQIIPGDNFQITYLLPTEFVGEIKVSLITEGEYPAQIVWTHPSPNTDVTPVEDKPTEAEGDEKLENPEGKEEPQAEDASPVNQESKAPAPRVEPILEDQAVQAFSYSKEEIIALCESENQRVETQRIVFPANSGCGFGEDGNFEAQDWHIQAKKSQIAKLPLKPNYVLCGINLASNYFMVDDFGVFNLNGKSILINNDGLVCDEQEPNNDPDDENTCLRKGNNQLVTWDFANIQGSEMDFSAPSYCYGQEDSGTECNMPGHDEYGQLSYRLGVSHSASLAADFKDKSEVDLELVTLGDNDSSDCQNSRIRLRFRINYAPIPGFATP